jgi:hypothetical protein
MNSILYELAEFLTTPLFRWLFLLLGVILTILQYLNSPQRFSYVNARFGLSFKWYMYLLCMFNLFTSSLTTVGQWITIPFTDMLPDYWYIYVFIICFAIITQITIDSPQYSNDGTFTPPPNYMLTQKYRVIISYCSVIVDTILMLQVYIYFGITDITKKTLLSTYVLERFGGWIDGNKLDFLFEWSGIIDVLIKIYILALQRDFFACEYDLPSSWNA